jgi:hypothetical protein
MRVHFNRGAHDSAFERRQRFHPEPQAIPVERNLHGHAVTRKIKRAVCQACNESWMSAIEVAARSAVESMLLGSAVLLTRGLKRAVSEWIVLKLMVFERQDGSKPVFTRAQTLAFAQERRIPDRLAIDLFRTEDDRLRSVIHRESAAIEPTDHAPGQTVAMNTQAVTFGVGRLLIFARHTQLEGLGFKSLSPRNATRLWPSEEDELTWPPAKVATWNEALFMQTSLGRMLSKMAPS